MNYSLEASSRKGNLTLNVGDDPFSPQTALSSHNRGRAEIHQQYMTAKAPQQQYNPFFVGQQSTSSSRVSKAKNSQTLSHPYHTRSFSNYSRKDLYGKRGGIPLPSEQETIESDEHFE